MWHAAGFTQGARPITKSHPEEKWAWHRARRAFQNLAFTFCISATAEANDFKFCTQLGFANPVIKSHSEAKSAWPRAGGAPESGWFPYDISAKAEASDFKFCV